jgi:actin-like ATPase involved in cell morphogenesis
VFFVRRFQAICIPSENSWRLKKASREIAEHAGAKEVYIVRCQMPPPSGRN